MNNVAPINSVQDFSGRAPVASTGGDYIPPSETLSTSGGGGGGDEELRTRVKVLETHVEHIQTDISTVKDDIRDMRNVGLGVAIALLSGLGGLFFYLDSKTDSLDEKLNNLNIQITKEIGEFNTEISSVRSQNIRIIDDIDTLQQSVNKLVGINEIIKE